MFVTWSIGEVRFTGRCLGESTQANHPRCAPLPKVQGCLVRASSVFRSFRDYFAVIAAKMPRAHHNAPESNQASQDQPVRLLVAGVQRSRLRRKSAGTASARHELGQEPLARPQGPAVRSSTREPQRPCREGPKRRRVRSLRHGDIWVRGEPE